MLGTSIISSSFTREAMAHPNWILIRSASGIGVLRPMAMSLVKCDPPTGITAVCITLPSAKIARSVVPPPKSTIATPSSRSSSVSTASLEARGCRMMPIPPSPARSPLWTSFWIAARPPVMMCTLPFRGPPDSPRGSGAHLKVNVHITRGAMTAIQNLVKSVERAGLDVIGIILQPLASSEAVLTDDERELGVAMVDLGGGTTDLAIFAEGSVMHTAVIPVGGSHFTNDIAIGLKTPMPDAERIKIQFGCAMASLVKDDEMIDVPSMGGRPPRSLSCRLLADVIEPRAEEVFDLVAREIKRAGYEGIVAGGVVLTGGTSLMEGMPDVAERVLDLPARRGYPWGVGGIREQVDNPVYATGVGLILHALHHHDDLALNGRRSRRGLWRTVENVTGWFREFF